MATSISNFFVSLFLIKDRFSLLIIFIKIFTNLIANLMIIIFFITKFLKIIKVKFKD